jgi:GGDEF domain-containing protein
MQIRGGQKVQINRPEEVEPNRYPGAVQTHAALLMNDPTSATIESANESRAKRAWTVKLADAAMYLAKDRGKNTVAIYSGK